MIVQPDGTRLLDQNGFLIFASGGPGMPTANVQRGNGGVEVSVSSAVSFIGIYLTPEVARAMARALDRAADLADLP